jgi:hypothetical protein
MVAAVAPSGWQGEAGACQGCAGGVHAPMAAAAAPPGGPGGIGACHNCGELSHYKNGCPYPRRNSSGRGQGGGGGRGEGKTPRACFVCGNLAHLAGQCPKRVIPAAALAVPAGAEGGMRSVEFLGWQAFEEWRAMTAAVATEAEGSGEEEEEWDDQGYALGAVALPLEGTVGMVQVAAAGTKAGAEKARATRAAAKKGQGKGMDGGAVAVQTAGGGGTALIAKPLDAAATAALRGRRDKAAAKERLGKLPNHGRHVAPQGLNRLPAGFPVRTPAPQTQEASVLAAQHIPAGVDAEHRVPVLPLRAEAPLRRVTPPRGASPVGSGTEPMLTGEVHIQVDAFLEIALRAGLDMAALAALTGTGTRPTVGVQQESATPAALERCAPKALAQQAGAMMGLSSIAQRAQAAAGQPGAVGALGAGDLGSGGLGLLRRKASGVGSGVTRAQQQEAASWTVPGDVNSARLKEGAGGKQKVGTGGVPAVPSLRLYMEEPRVVTPPSCCQAVVWDPKSSNMEALRRAPVADEAGDAAMAQRVPRQEEQARKKQLTATSRDAELAMLLVAEEAREKGVDREVALRAQSGGKDGSVAPSARGKGIAELAEQGVDERAFGWERRLSEGKWRGAADLAPITLQPRASEVAEASQSYTHALACFADGRPLVSAAERVDLEGTPDWVDNAHKVVQVMSSHGLVAPARVLLDGNSFY